MFLNSFFDRYTFIPEKAVEYGFRRENGFYVISKPLDEKGFYAEFKISENLIEADVYEEPDGELYLPFNTNSDGAFVSKIRACVDEAMNQILDSCFALADVKAVLLEYVREEYGTIPEAPWGYLKEHHTLNTQKRHKWYGIFMLIPYNSLGIEKEGKIHVLNLKAEPEDIVDLIDNVHYFPAYHMNKKYWISILLDRKADVEFIKKLLDNSYAIVEGKKG